MMHRLSIEIEPGDVQRDYLEKMFSQAFHFRKTFFQEKVDAEVAEEDFNVAQWVDEYKAHLKQRYPGKRLNLNVFEAMADLLQLGEYEVTGHWVGFSKGIQVTRRSIWLPLLHVIPIRGDTEIDRNPDYLVITSEKGAYEADLLWEE